MKLVKNEVQKEKKTLEVKKKGTDQSFGDLQDDIKWSNICIIGIPEGGGWGQIIKIYSNDQNSASKKVLVQPKNDFYITYDVNYMYIEYKVGILLSVRLPLQSGVGNIDSYNNLNIPFLKYILNSQKMSRYIKHLLR